MSATLGQFLDRGDQMLEITAEPVEFPHDEDIPFTQRFETGGQTGAIGVLARGVILVNVLRSNTRLNQGVLLQIERL